MSLSRASEEWDIDQHLWNQARTLLDECLERGNVPEQAFVRSVKKAAREAAQDFRRRFANETFSKILQTIMNNDGMTQDELGVVLGCNQSEVSRYLHGRVDCHLEQFEEFLALLGVDERLLLPDRQCERQLLYRVRLLAAMNEIRYEWLHRRAILAGFEDAMFSEVLDMDHLKLFITEVRQIKSRHVACQAIDELSQKYFGSFIPFILAAFVIEGPTDED